MARTLPNSKVNPEKIDSDEAYNRAINRGDKLAQSRLNPQPAEQQHTNHPDILDGDHGGEG